jgi:hypothetical protein
MARIREQGDTVRNLLEYPVTRPEVVTILLAEASRERGIGSLTPMILRHTAEYIRGMTPEVWELYQRGLNPEKL